jgi:predicted membrane-bound spermidine synthase
LLYFAAFELGIGAFGLISLPLFRLVGAATAGASAPATFAITLALVVVPTSMMGATLPLLVAHVVEQLRNVGRSVGNLYFVNTLGSAFASIATAIFLMRYLGLQGTVWFAAAINIAAGSFILLAWMRGRRS